MSCTFTKSVHVPSLLGMLLAVLPLTGCSGDNGRPGASTGTVAGAVTNNADSDAAIVGAVIAMTPAVPGVTMTTDANGNYSASLPTGVYTLEASSRHFVSETVTVSVPAAVRQTVDFGLDPVSDVVVEIASPLAEYQPGDSFDLNANVTVLNGSSIQGYEWIQTHSASAEIVNADSPAPTITLGDDTEYKQALVEAVRPQNRFEVLGLDPFALEEGGMVTFECAVTTSSGVYTGEVDIHAQLTFCDRSSGLRNVPVGVPVLLGSKEQEEYDWTLTAPSGSLAALNDATTANPWWTPDVPGVYRLTVTDQDLGHQILMDVFAAEWMGGIIGQDENGRPLTNCTTACHSGIFTDTFTDWAYSGHAEIFTDNLNTGGHYSSDCFACHTVGYDPDAHNGGFDDSRDFDLFMSEMFPGGISHADQDNWNSVIRDWPNQAQMANIQCESCHGPNGSFGAHMRGHDLGSARVNASPYVCGQCHGEPLRHARFQQWQDSAHGNYEVAMEEGTRGSCAKCHTAQGFLEWNANNHDLAYTPAGVAEDEIHPITCAVCHDPHKVGTVSGNANDVEMRVEGDSPPLLAGFTAYNIGHGAQCIVCHNSRRGLANDSVGLVNPSAFDQAPHGGTQGDMLMGQNAFFVNVGLRRGHSLISDSCTTCHMQLTDPPEDLSNNLDGTNHGFEADRTICSECHGQFDSDNLVDLAESRMVALADQIAEAIRNEILFHTGAPNEDTVEITGEVEGASMTALITAGSVIDSIELSESHGRVAMNIDVDGTLYEHVRLSSDTALVNAGGTLLDNVVPGNNGPVLAKSCWNYFLVHNDGSRSIHNPGFFDEIMVNTSAMIRSIWQ